MAVDKVKGPWELFVDQGLQPLEIQPKVLASWQRCRALGIDPWQVPQGMCLQKQQLLERQHKAGAVLRVCQPFMEKISGFTQPGILVFLSDPGGCIVATVGEGDPALFQMFSFAPGSLWQEEDQGTNAIALALREKVPCQVEGAEHYLQAFHSLTCAAVPMVAPGGEFLGILGVVGPKEKCHHHTLGMVIATVRAMEKQLELEQTSDQLVSVVQSISEGLISVDNKGIVKQMNTVAGKIFGLDPHWCVGKPIEEVFHNSFPLLRMIKTGREGFNDRELAVDIQGRRVHITVTSRPIRSQQEGVVGVVLTCREMKSVQRLVTRMVGAQARFEFGDLIGEDPKFKEAIAMAKRVARTDSTVLIMGESGTGKEMFAQAVHNASPRRDGPFVAMNCAALPRELVESELFGYEEGSFTGAKRGGRPGKFELATGGTLFLDEIGDIPLETQATLLRVLQEKQVVRIGGHTPIPVQIRFIAATNRDIATMVEEGHFRLDLFHRLSVINLFIPPLRHRREDVFLLAGYFLQRFTAQFSHEPIVLDPPVEQAFLNYHWPGNVRELQNVLEQALHLVDGGVLETQHLPARVLSSSTMAMGLGPLTAGYTLAQLERSAIIKAMESCQGNVSKAATSLGVGRTTLYRKLKGYGYNLKNLREEK